MFRSHLHRAFVPLILALAGTNFGACAIKRWVNEQRGAETQPASVASSDVNTGLIALGSGDVRGEIIAQDPSTAPSGEADTSELVNQAAVDLERILATGLPARKPRPAPQASQSPVEASVPLSSDRQIDADALRRADEEWNARAAKELEAAQASAPDTVGDGQPHNNDDKLVALASRIASLLRDRTSTGEPVISDSVAVAMIEAYEEGACAGLDDEKSTLRNRLSEDDVRTLIGARDAAAKELETPKAEEVREAIATVAPAPELRIPEAKLCTKVTGFGAYSTFASNVFPAGKKSRAIVYTSVEGFDARPAIAGDPVAPGTTITDQVSVELEQSLTLYQDSDDYQVWHRPPQRVVETARTKRRDFYLIQIIELAPTLAPGRYNLKIRLKDRTTGMTTESMIPIEISGR